MNAQEIADEDDPLELIRYLAPFYQINRRPFIGQHEFDRVHLRNDSQSVRRKLRLVVAAIARTYPIDFSNRMFERSLKFWRNGDCSPEEETGRINALSQTLKAVSHEWSTTSRRHKCDVIRCVFGDSVALGPFARVDGWRYWNGGLVVTMAQSIYDSENWNELGVLADALEDAGFANQAALAHLREVCPFCPGSKDGDDPNTGEPAPDGMTLVGVPCSCGGSRVVTHARGCWVVDAILQKTLPDAPWSG